jgi:hypothetical protein
VITVNGETIDPALVDEAFNRIKSDAETRSEISCCERDEEFRSRAEDEVIEGILLAQEAEKRTPEPPKEEIRSAFENTLREWREHGASWDLLEAQRNELREEVSARLRMEHFAQSIWSQLPDLDEAGLRDWYHLHAEDFRKPARAKVLHLIRFPENGEPGDEYRSLVEWRHQILDGADFGDIARSHTAKRDGDIDLGWIEHERVLNPFEAMLFSLRENEISPVFFYEQALHLVWVEALEPEQVTPFEEIEGEIRELALADQRRQALHELAVELRRTALIERPSSEPVA